MTRRDPDDKTQQRIAWHELGHALVGKRLGIKIGEVEHTGDSGRTTYKRDDQQWREYAIFCMAGSEAEWLWEKHNNGWFGSKGHCNGDLAMFTEAAQGRISESKARSEARRILQRHLADLRRLAPDLIRTGRLRGNQL